MKLTCENLCFGYGEKEILHKISFSMEVGEAVGIVAPSGFGKTTFAKILAGYEKPVSGTVATDAPVVGGFNPIQLIFQHPERAVNPKWTLGRTVEESWQPDQILYDHLGIKEEWLKRYPNELSGGEIQRFCVVRALNPNTKFLIADEMTTMLDAITTAQIWQVVQERVKKKEIGAMIISHERSMLEHLCGRIDRKSVV